ncbi:MAG: site-2 protease family protein [Planctomycetales bacterium]
MDHDPRPPQLPAAPVPPAEPPERSFLEVVDEAVHAPDEPMQPPTLRSRKRVALILFAATVVSTFVVGMKAGGGSIAFLFTREFLGATWPEFLVFFRDGAFYSLAVMGILLTHEMGHYVQARRHRVPATLPYFIPMPLIPFGTMGAVIVQGAGFADRKKLFDIAISGPLAGLVVALPVAWYGVKFAMIRPLETIAVGDTGLQYGEMLILKWMVAWIHGVDIATVNIELNPLLFAGWVRIFVTALNLIPIGQLDGGHILYTLIGRPAHYVALGILGLAIAAMFWFEYPAFGLLIVLLVLMGPRHPPTADDSVPLGPVRIVLGWLTLAFVFIGFTPMPIVELNGDEAARSAAAATERAGVAFSNIVHDP